MTMAPREPREVRDDQTDESDHARNGNGRRSEQRSRQVDAPLHGVDVGAEVARGFFAKREEIERPRGGQEHRDRDWRVQHDDQHGIPGCARQAAPQPQKGVAELTRVGERDDRGRDRGGERTDGHATEEQNPRIERGATDQAQAVDERQGRERARECRERQRPWPREVQRDRQDCAEAGAA